MTRANLYMNVFILLQRTSHKAEKKEITLVIQYIIASIKDKNFELTETKESLWPQCQIQWKLMNRQK